MVLQLFHKKFLMAMVMVFALALLPLSGKSQAGGGYCACSCCDLPQPAPTYIHVEAGRIPSPLTPSSMDSCCEAEAASWVFLNACEYRLPELAGSSRPRSGTLLPVDLALARHALSFHHPVKNSIDKTRTHSSGRPIPIFLSNLSFLC
ncbi:MAG: hypothetical protein JRD68_14300 [Deltaproteobacteria bacterium]|nr:hypothetical protein [Deltaproteobacteria bacterium]